MTRMLVIAGGGAVANLGVSLSRIGSSLTSLEIAITDAGGTFAFGSLQPGSYVLYSHDFVGRCDADTAVVPSGSAAAETASVVLTLRPGGAVRGVVTLSNQTDARGTT